MARDKQISKVFPTTTLTVNRPQSFEKLENEYLIYRYQIPQDFYQRYKDANYDQQKLLYAQIHNAFKEQITSPYKSFQHALIAGIKSWVFYILCPQNQTPPLIQIKDLRFPLSPDLISFESMWRDDWFNLLKLLQVAYFRGSHNNFFVGRDECYVYVDQSPSSSGTQNAHKCMLIKLSGWKRETNQIRVMGQVTTFREIKLNELEGGRHRDTYYGLSRVEVNSSQLLFSQLKTDQIQEYGSKGKQIFAPKPFYKGRTHLHYHTTDKIDASRGYILKSFIEGFMDYLREFDIEAEPYERTFIPFFPTLSNSYLNLNKLGTVHTYDVRHNRTIPIDKYVSLISVVAKENKTHKLNIAFKQVDSLDEKQKTVTIIVQDAVKKAYQEYGALYPPEKFTDPHDTFYKQYPLIPKQFLNVNQQGDPAKDDAESYLKYPLLSPKDLKQSLLVCLNQLFLKSLVLSTLDVVEYELPLAPVDYVFIRKATYNRTSCEVMMYFDGNTLQFLHIQDTKSRAIRNQFLSDLGLNWDELFETLLDKYKPTRDKKENYLSSYDLVLCKGTAIDIEDMEESVLYDYQTMKERKDARIKKLPVENLKLSKHFDEKKWRDYDQALESLSIDGELSIDDLSEEVAFEKLVPILFGDKSEEEKKKIDNKIYMGALLRPYQKLGMFQSPKESSLHLFDGIWYTADNCFLIGSKSTMSQKGQPNAHLVRKFDFIVGDSNPIIVQDLLNSCSVLFVRYEEYTVIPYYFHLIDLYVENKILFSSDSDEEV